MKEPKKVKKALDTLERLVYYLSYYMNGTPEFKEFQADIEYLDQLVRDLSIDQKIQNAELAKKIKEELEEADTDFSNEKVD